MSVYSYKAPKPKTTRYGSKWRKKYGNNWQNPAATEWESAGGGQQQQQQQGGGNPYQGLIENMLGQQRADIHSESMADAAQRDAAIRRMLVSWGEAPVSGLSGEASGVLGGVLDENTRQLIAQNTAAGTSAKARIEDANTKALAAIPQHLAGRGMARSGEMGYQQAEQAKAHTTTMFDALNEMLGGVEGAVGSYAANERQRQRALADAEMEAAWQSADLWGGQDFGQEDVAEEGGGNFDEYWNNLIAYYSGIPQKVGGKKKKAKKVKKGGGGGGHKAQ